MARLDPDPGGGLEGKHFVPVGARSQVFQRGHSSKFACHPWSFHMLTLLRRQFWWPRMKDVQEFVAACAVCARDNALHRPPSGLLQPLPVPSRPRSHIAVDFLLGLRTFVGNDTILTVVDKFSKSANLCHYQNYPLPLRRVTSWSVTCPACKALLGTLCQTEAHSLLPMYGKHFALPLGHLLVTPQVSILNLMVKRSGPNKIWGLPSAVSWRRTRASGHSSSLGGLPSPPPLQGNRRLRWRWDTSRLFFQTRRGSWWLPLSRLTFIIAIGFGERLVKALLR